MRSYRSCQELPISYAFRAEEEAGVESFRFARAGRKSCNTSHTASELCGQTFQAVIIRRRNSSGTLPEATPRSLKIVLVLFLSFLIGLQREEHKAAGVSYSFGGVRTFPLIGLIGYSIALISGSQLLPLTVGFLVVAAFLLLSYWHKLSSTQTAGVTSEMSGLTTFLVGALVYYGHFWIATTLSVASLLLLDLKAALEKLAVRIAPQEILTFAKFLLLTGVILPVLPNQEFGRFHINPFKTWLVVVAVSCDLLWQLRSAEVDEGTGRSRAISFAWRGVFFDRHYRGHCAPGRS